MNYPQALCNPPAKREDVFLMSMLLFLRPIAYPPAGLSIKRNMVTYHLE